MKAFILAAGFGTRLRPLTHTTPKILVPVLGLPQLDRLAAFLAGKGVTRLALNTHHLAPRVEAHLAVLRGEFPHVSFTSFFEPEILGTGGGVANTLSFWDGDPLLLWNGDIIAQVDVDALARDHSAEGGLATLVVQDRPSNSRLLVDRAGFVRGLDSPRRGVHRVIGTPEGKLTPLAYNGAAMLAPALQPHLPGGPSYDLIDALLTAMEQGGRVRAFDMGDGFFGTCGSPESLAQLEAGLAADAGLRTLWGG